MPRRRLAVPREDGGSRGRAHESDEPANGGGWMSSRHHEERFAIRVRPVDHGPDARHDPIQRQHAEARFSERTRDRVVPPKAPGTLSMASAASGPSWPRSSPCGAWRCRPPRSSPGTSPSGPGYPNPRGGAEPPGSVCRPPIALSGVDLDDPFQRHAGDLRTG